MIHAMNSLSKLFWIIACNTKLSLIRLVLRLAFYNCLKTSARLLPQSGTLSRQMFKLRLICWSLTKELTVILQLLYLLQKTQKQMPKLATEPQYKLHLSQQQKSFNNRLSFLQDLPRTGGFQQIFAH